VCESAPPSQTFAQTPPPMSISATVSPKIVFMSVTPTGVTNLGEPKWFRTGPGEATSQMLGLFAEFERPGAGHGRPQPGKG
jgi:hypothetical protein